MALFTLLNAPRDLEYVYACDLKVISMATGFSSHSSTHPYPYCTSRAIQWDPDAPLQTNMYYFNCLNPPLLNSNLPILLLCPPHPLHLKLGTVNPLMRHLFSLHPHLEKENFRNSQEGPSWKVFRRATMF